MLSERAGPVCSSTRGETPGLGLVSVLGCQLCDRATQAQSDQYGKGCRRRPHLRVQLGARDDGVERKAERERECPFCDRLAQMQEAYH